jgi:hypothetical protein
VRRQGRGSFEALKDGPDGANVEAQAAGEMPADLRAQLGTALGAHGNFRERSYVSRRDVRSMHRLTEEEAMFLEGSDLAVLRSQRVQFEGETDLGPVKLTPAKLKTITF